MSDLYTDELTDPTGDRTLRLTVDHEGVAWLTVETARDPYGAHTIRGGEALLIWLQASAESALFAAQRQEAA